MALPETRKRRPHIRAKWRARAPRDRLLAELNRTGSVIGAAVALNISIASTYRWIHKYGLESKKGWR